MKPRFLHVTSATVATLLAVVCDWSIGLAPAAVHAGEIGAAVEILIVKSDDLPQYDAPIEAFLDQMDASTRTLCIFGSREEGTQALGQVIESGKPRAVFALGAQAAHLSRSLLPDTPMVFAMVLGWERYAFSRGPATGVAVDVPVEVLFTHFKLILPELDTLGVIYSDHSSASMERARQAAGSVGIRLREEEVGHADEVQGAYRRLRTEVDALWMVPDPVVVTVDNFRYLATRTRHDELAFLTFSENFARAGGLLSVAPDYRTVGAQAAVLLERLLENPATPPPVQSPMASKLVVNRETADSLGIHLDADVIDIADIIVGYEREETP